MNSSSGWNFTDPATLAKESKSHGVAWKRGVNIGALLFP